MHTAAERFMRLVTYNTQSDYNSKTYPSTPQQRDFARLLADECRAIGLTDVSVDDYGYVTAALNANTEAPVIGLLAHMDTSSDAPGVNIKPRIVEAYDGSAIRLGNGRTLDPDAFTHLKKYIGQDLIVAGGDTLLGADDKAGVAEIITAMEYLVNHPEIQHGTIRVAFTPDEEIGRGVDHFDVTSFGADFAYTVDGGELGELQTETFNAARAVFTISGKSVHPGYAKGVMLNASLVANEIMSAFPCTETPAHTEGREGYYHLFSLSGETSRAELSYLIRDFSPEGIETRKRFVSELSEQFNAKYGSDTVELTLSDEYRNMAEVLDGKPEIAARAEAAMRKAGVTPLLNPVRGGTDGTRLSFMGLPCPNLFTGGHNFHGPYEYIPIPSMDAAVRVIVNLCTAE